ncbi:LacI family DNA-binding transcriptional regulator [Sphingobacterium griseoflavum]|uniref:LacI family transcriptional regulator n=1 Tax=Sphingobacterium griseoflavum TaxID=1474952 RepID=A0ABQ3HW05_9SPHI|nr:LacI family DNA-binding transcriptional regulator [Sphingobacterium griseoflavum]GHE33439.1 LacI family transcriptional regulator [Sphingobacterium griseoflavum]
MAKKTTIYDIAKELNITVSTVSRALNNISTISERTRESVLEMAKKLNYRPNKVASSLTSGKTFIIGVLLPSAQIQFFASVIHSLEKYLKSFGYSILLYQTNESLESEKNGISTLLEAQVDGIIASLSLETQDLSHLGKVKEEGKPLIIFDRTHDDLLVPVVKIDDELAGYMATKHLLDQGYKKIAYITTKHHIKIFKERYDGYQKALEEAGLEAHAAYAIFGELTVDGGYLGTHQLLRLKERPDAIIGGDDYVALGIIKALHEHQITPPTIGVIGFANQNFSEHIIPSLSTIDQQAIQMGKECAKLFLKIIERKDSDDKEMEPVVLKPILLARESTNRKSARSLHS